MKSFLFATSLAALAVGCIGEAPDSGAPTDDPECQIQTEAEKSPGYPFDLAMYTNEVLPIVTQNCALGGCHAPSDAQGGLAIWAAAAPGNCEFAQTFNSMKNFVDLATPENSALYIALTGENPLHPTIYPADDPRLLTIQAYVKNASDTFIADGGAGDPAPPGASPFDYAVYQNNIQPILDAADNRGCAAAGCHGTGQGGFWLTANPARDSAEMEKNFIEVTRRTNLNTPETSLVYMQAITLHAAGTSAQVTAGQAQELLAWIQQAKETAGDGGAVGCAPLDRFNVGVFRDEILPILRGDLDLNNPGSGVSTTGCMRGPCHGTDRGPGILMLADSLTPEQNLQNFSCFVDLTNPSASQALVCPLNDPRCSKYPHPGQTVLAGANDLNYQRLLAYIYGSKLDATPLDFAFFVRRINPIFNDLNAVEGGAQGRTCADAASCHGITVVGQPAPNGSNFPILPNASDKARLTFNFVTAANFVNLLNPEESSLFLYPTNEIANVADHPLATGLPHPGGADFAVDSNEARLILEWAHGLRPDAQGFVRNWLVAGDYAAGLITDVTPINEAAAEPAIFDPTGAPQFNNGEWDGLFSVEELVDLNQAFPRDATTGRVAYAVVYAVNTTSLDINALITIDSPNAMRIYVGPTLVAQSAGGETTAVANLPSYSVSKAPTRILIKLFQRAGDDEFAFTARLQDELGNLLTNATGEVILTLGPEGGI
jgi:hypothetical protein